MHFGIIIYNLIYRPQETSIDTSIYIVGLILLYIFHDKLHQDNYSFTALIILSLMHNIKIYHIVIFGAEWEHYIHTAGGAVAALAIDRLFREKLSLSKRIFLYLLAALGLGAVLEIIEWSGQMIQGNAPGLFGVGIGDLAGGVWSNTIIDMIYNTLGAVFFSFYVVIRKKFPSK
ncbi:MAG: hypothetical protein ACOCXG_03965 [Nanoarchaeota archaeon]